jgi:hypothetical protein
MSVIRGTKKVLDRLPVIDRAGEAERSTSRLGDWYVNVLFWKPQAALFVSETTLLPVLIPFAPAATLLDRFPDALLAHLQAQEAPRAFPEAELAEMAQRRLAKTASRSILGVMNEFRFLADAYHHDDDAEIDLLTLSMRLSETPCSPLYKRHVSPDRELAALVRG